MWQVDVPAASSSKLVESDRARRTAEHLHCSRVRPWGAAWSPGLSLHPVPQKQWDPLCPSAGFPPTPPTPPCSRCSLPARSSPRCLPYLCPALSLLTIPFPVMSLSALQFFPKVVSTENSVAETKEDAKAPKYLTPRLSLTCLLYPHTF